MNTWAQRVWHFFNREFGWWVVVTPLCILWLAVGMFTGRISDPLSASGLLALVIVGPYVLEKLLLSFTRRKPARL